MKRNAWKRRIREAFRKQFHQLPQGYDFVELPRRGAEPDFDRIRQSVVSLARRLEKRALKRAQNSKGADSFKDEERRKKPGDRKHYGRGKGKHTTKEADASGATGQQNSGDR